MTATVTGQPDLELILRRAARRAGEDVPDEAITAFADAVRPLLGAGHVDEGTLAELEKLRGELASTQEVLESEHNAVAAIGDALRNRTGELNGARAEVAALKRHRAVLWDLLKDAARERRDGWKEAERLEVALAERSVLDDERHHHEYLVAQPGELPGPCRCGKPYPRAHLADPGEYEPEEPDAWSRFFAGLRTDLADCPTGRKTT